MSKRTTFTTISPLPADIGRQPVLDFFHNHEGMIDLNPLVIERHPLPEPPPHCPDEERECVWWSMTDKITYMPGVKSDLTYTAAFQDLHDGIRTHCYAPMGTHIRERWSLGGTLPGEPKQPVELGLGAPSQGLYIREDVEVRCNFLMAGFVKKTILKSHGVLVERLVAGARAQAAKSSSSPNSSVVAGARPSMPLSPSSTTFYEGHPADMRSSSVHDEQRKYSGDASGRSTPHDSIGQRDSPPPSTHNHQAHQYHHQYQPQYQQQQQQQQSQAQHPGQNQHFYEHQRAAASETGLVPESLRAGRSSGQFNTQGHVRHESGQVYSGLGWQQAPGPKPYIHDPHSPYTQQQQQSQRRPSGPVAELAGSETHINELQ
ncbi:hypothetical protein PFICI_04257 [Pestalotiopsis fici W106-1]|uniref:DUF7053 domain-containing protein n=1 Tax=Pestalotiopsis fici (strain W106-1 / CGMCC3.15140) TaxID=1229662 RepID=W3XB21_PESFW|nr:uncharacterized protein PFICI_04257 [Pestalotiopsis fici W106-1]ETS82381.1 hypothetical protein PFICI_04257 [Pestalotiopsis fici W106-1]